MDNLNLCSNFFFSIISLKIISLSLSPYGRILISWFTNSYPSLSKFFLWFSCPTNLLNSLWHFNFMVVYVVWALVALFLLWTCCFIMSNSLTYCWMINNPLLILFQSWFSWNCLLLIFWASQLVFEPLIDLKSHILYLATWTLSLFDNK